MAQTAAHLVDRVIPRVPVRQWALALPIPLRLLLAVLGLRVNPAPLVTPQLPKTIRCADRCALNLLERRVTAPCGGITALLHHVNVDLLRDAFLALKRRAA